MPNVLSLKNPHTYFPQARSIVGGRTVIAHLGPTNSGKTHAAIQALLESPTGAYCGPLRLLAQEQWERSRTKVRMGLRTGETVLNWQGGSPAEQDWREHGATHLACTVEMAELGRPGRTPPFQSAVLDEVQMAADKDRGWAFSTVLLGMPCKELYVCGESAMEPLLQRLCQLTGDTLQVRHFDRLTPLAMLRKPVQIADLQPGDAVIAFSRRDIFHLKSVIEARLGRPDQCAVVYGGLPLEHRAVQAERFNSRKVPLLVASDAIGLGLNLNIGRVLFASLSKFTPASGEAAVDSRLVKQIGGRAGRFGTAFQQGQVGVLQVAGDTAAQALQSQLHKLWHRPVVPYDRLGLLPPDDQLVQAAGDASSLVRVFESLEGGQCVVDPDFFVCSTRPNRLTLQVVKDFLGALSVEDALTLARAPVRHARPVAHNVLTAMTSHLAKCKLAEQFILPDLSIYYGKQRGAAEREQRMGEAEEVYRALDLYRWIAMRFPHAFHPDTEQVSQQRTKCTRFIKECLG